MPTVVTGQCTDYTVTIFPTPNLSNAPAAKTQCDNLPTNINLTSNVAGTQFTWTCTPSSASITGWANSAAPGILINQTLDNTGYQYRNRDVSPHTNGQWLHRAGDGLRCYMSIPLLTFPTHPFPNPNVTMSPTNITLTSNVAGTLFTWTCVPSSASITGWSNNPCSYNRSEPDT